LDEALVTIGDRLKQLRGGKSREEFAQKYGIHPNTLARWEKGTRSPDLDFVIAICADMHVEPRWLLFGEDQLHGECSGRSDIIYIDPAVQLIDEALKDTGIIINKKQKMAVIELIREELKQKAVNMLKAIKWSGE